MLVINLSIAVHFCGFYRATLCYTWSISTAYNLPKSQTNRLQVIQNSLARAVVKATKFCHVTPILKSRHWLKINERIEYKLLSLRL